MQDKFVIRPIRKGDAVDQHAVVSLVNRCYRSEESWTTEAHLVSGQRITLARLRETPQDFEVFVVEDRSTRDIAACIKTGVAKEGVCGPFKEAVGYLGLFAVSPEYQSQGLGTRLVRFAEDYCRKKGMKEMALDVLDQRKDLIRWYERYGYSRTGQSLDAGPFMKAKGEQLLIPCHFICMMKDLGDV